MEQTLHALGRILLNAVPTVVFLVLLQVYLRFVFFKPLEKLLAQRYNLSEGARKSAEESVAAAERRVAAYQGQLAAARNEIIGEQEKFHRELQTEHEAEVARMRQQADERIAVARKEIAAESEAARAGLEAQSEMLANEIAAAILRRAA